MIKKAFWSNLVKAIELALVLVLGFLICFVASGLLYGNIYIGVAVYQRITKQNNKRKIGR